MKITPILMLNVNMTIFELCFLKRHVLFNAQKSKVKDLRPHSPRSDKIIQVLCAIICRLIFCVYTCM